MISFAEACAIVSDLARPLGMEVVRLAVARGRILAKPAIAAIDAPRRAVSTMDGYAVREADLAALPARLPVAQSVYPGSTESAPLAPESCARIFTGAPLPVDADRVVMQEEVTREGEFAIFGTPPSSARFWRASGSDFTMGTVLVEAGRALGAREIVAAAGGDLGSLACWRRPRVALLATGDELVPPGKARDRPEGVPESVLPGIAALVGDCGGETVLSEVRADSLALLERAAADALAVADLVVVVGGASVGERDHARAMFEAYSLELLFSKVAMKPGKPVWLGRCGKALVAGLPGNPTSAMVTARLLLAPLVAGLAGGRIEEYWRWRSVELAARLDSGSDRETFVRARMVEGRAHPAANQDSGAQSTLAAADLLLRVPVNASPRQAGEQAEALTF